ncbi:PilZ domain-containing protein [Methylobacterium flocculans]|uniref:PilZ domain-containing protein n=1 Tax=Methylobacterium flocculans TaxID=2984843 RepID=UPI0021F2B457|nr:PilZ domain-containing protein [Methylobacterium sp. FF17]
MTGEASFGEREARAETNWIGVIRTSEGIEIPCTVKDVSKTGARIWVPASYHLPENFMLRVLGKDFVCKVAMAWRKGNFVGVRIERIGKLPQKQAETIADSETVASKHQVIGSRRSRISAF